jgi:hypothetical protein
MTIDKMIEKFPWMESFRSDMQEQCHDCGAKLGQKHKRGCDTARCLVCGGQRLGCDCKGGHGDIWTGLMYPEYHKICLEQDFWCHTLLYIDSEWVPLDWENSFLREKYHSFLNNSTTYNKVRHHIPCKKDDVGARAALNEAAKFYFRNRK